MLYQGAIALLGTKLSFLSDRASCTISPEWRRTGS